MKKLIVVLLATLMLMSIVSARGVNIPEEKIIKNNGNFSDIRENPLVGIENAITRGNKTNETIQKLTEILNKIEDKRVEQISKLENLKINETDDGKVKVEGEIVGKMLGLFKVKHTERFEISEDGTVKELGWFKWLWNDN